VERGHVGSGNDLDVPALAGAARLQHVALGRPVRPDTGVPDVKQLKSGRLVVRVTVPRRCMLQTMQAKDWC
jgi:hypothetical protein